MSNHWRLFALLTIATFFEGFDTRLVALVQPVIGREFGASKEELGFVVGLSSVGMMFAFFVIHLADRVGRRSVFLAALGGYALFTLATAFSPNLQVFTALQVFARMAMVAELGLAYLILSEEMPPEIRGRVNGIFGAFVAFGASVPDALLHPLEQVGVGWRGLFLIGAVPLLLLPLYALNLRETRAFEAQRARRRAGEAGRSGFEEERALLRALAEPAHRGRLARIAGIWLVISFWSATAPYFFTLYVFDERGWTSADLMWLPLGTIPCGILGYSLAGLAMDRFGRRGAAMAYLATATVATIVCYTSRSDGALAASYFALIGLGGIWAIATTWTAELFPTELRATATGFGNNLVGRLGFFIGPILAGQLGGALDSTGRAMAYLSLAPLLALPLALRLPETRGIVLTTADTRTQRDGLS